MQDIHVLQINKKWAETFTLSFFVGTGTQNNFNRDGSSGGLSIQSLSRIRGS